VPLGRLATGFERLGNQRVFGVRLLHFPPSFEVIMKGIWKYIIGLIVSGAFLVTLEAHNVDKTIAWAVGLAAMILIVVEMGRSEDD